LKKGAAEGQRPLPFFGIPLHNPKRIVARTCFNFVSTIEAFQKNWNRGELLLLVLRRAALLSCVELTVRRRRRGAAAATARVNPTRAARSACGRALLHAVIGVNAMTPFRAVMSGQLLWSKRGGGLQFALVARKDERLCSALKLPDAAGLACLRWQPISHRPEERSNVHGTANSFRHSKR